MNFSRALRRALSLFVMSLLLFYQGAMAAQVCDTIPLPGANSAAGSPCHSHEGGDQQDNTGTLPAAPCHYAQVPSDSWQPNVPSVAKLPSLPAVSVAYTAAPRPMRAAVAVAPPCPSPPLTVLHCRLRN